MHFNAQLIIHIMIQSCKHMAVVGTQSFNGTQASKSEYVTS